MKTDVAALGRCNGMDEMDKQGSYVKLVYHHEGENYHLTISEGCAENLINQLTGALDKRPPDPNCRTCAGMGYWLDSVGKHPCRCVVG